MFMKSCSISRARQIFRPEVAKLRRKLEQLDEEHEREVQHLKQQIKELKAIVQQTSPRLSSEKPAEPASERIDKGDLSLDEQGW